jgi:hypothetical protein
MQGPADCLEDRIRMGSLPRTQESRHGFPRRFPDPAADQVRVRHRAANGAGNFLLHSRRSRLSHMI